MKTPRKKQKVLKQYTDLSAHNLSGNKVVLSLKMVCSNLEEKSRLARGKYSEK